MRWPFVSRRAYDDMRESRDNERELCANLRADLGDLRRQYHELRTTTGANPPLPVAQRATKEDPVVTAILVTSRGNAILRKQFFEYANEQRAAGLSEAEIAERIIEGLPDVDGVPE